MRVLAAPMTSSTLAVLPVPGTPDTYREPPPASGPAPVAALPGILAVHAHVLAGAARSEALSQEFGSSQAQESQPRLCRRLAGQTRKGGGPCCARSQRLPTHLPERPAPQSA